jgi:capsular exopolysaccharide synthesis family protein
LDTQLDTIGDEQAFDTSHRTGLSNILPLLRRGRWIILGSVLVMTAAAALYTVLSKPTYAASTLVLIDSRGAQAGLPFADPSNIVSSTKVANEIEALKSQSVTEGVAQALLARVYIDSTKGAEGGVLPIIKLTKHGGDELASVQEVMRRLEDAMTISLVKESDVIKITIRSADPVEAALIANTYTEVYLQRNLQMTREKSRAVREFLQEQVQSKQATLASRDEALQGYMNKSGIVSLDDETRRVVEQMATLEATDEALGVDITAKRKTLESYKQELATLEPSIAHSLSQSNDSYIRMLQEQLAKLEVDRDLAMANNPLLGEHGADSVSMRDVDVKIVNLKKNLQERTSEFVHSVVPGEVNMAGREGRASFLSQLKQRIVESQIELDGLVARKEALDSVLTKSGRQFSKMPKKTIQLAKLQRARISSEKLYEMVEGKFNEAAIRERSEFGSVTIMDRATIPDKPVSPGLASNLVAGAIFGSLLGVGVVIVRARLDKRINDPQELKKRGYKLYTTIGKIVSTNGEAGASAEAKDHTFDPHLVSYYAPYSPVSESYRHLMMGILRTKDGKPIRRVMFTSPNPGEGKSTTAANLAVAASQMQSRVLLIDSDLRRPALHPIFNVKKEPGLSDFLEGRKRLEDVVQRGVLHQLDFVASGKEVEHSARALMSKMMKELIDHFSFHYDLMLFDTPPLLAVTDPTLLCGYMDLSIIVVSAGSTRSDELERAQEDLLAAGSRASGVVFNRYDHRTAYGRYYGKDLYSYSSYSYGKPRTDGNSSKEGSVKGGS